MRAGRARTQSLGPDDDSGEGGGDPYLLHQVDPCRSASLKAAALVPKSWPPSGPLTNRTASPPPSMPEADVKGQDDDEPADDQLEAAERRDRQARAAWLPDVQASTSLTSWELRVATEATHGATGRPQPSAFDPLVQGDVPKGVEELGGQPHAIPKRPRSYAGQISTSAW